MKPVVLVMAAISDGLLTFVEQRPDASEALVRAVAKGFAKIGEIIDHAEDSEQRRELDRLRGQVFDHSALRERMRELEDTVERLREDAAAARHA